MTARTTLTGISFKEVLILLFFVERENKPTHATGIEIELERMNIHVLFPEGGVPASISRRWSRRICEQLVKDGLLIYDERKVWRQKSLVKFYHLIENLEMLKKLAPRVMPLFGGLLIRKNFVQKIVEKDLTTALEEHYKVKLDENISERILTLVLSSTKAFEIALRLLELPMEEVKSSKKRNEEIGNILVGTLLAGFITELSERGLRWREELLEKITVYMKVRFKAGSAEDIIESTLDFVSREKPTIVDILRGGGSRISRVIKENRNDDEGITQKGKRITSGE